MSLDEIIKDIARKEKEKDSDAEIVRIEEFDDGSVIKTVVSDREGVLVLSINTKEDIIMGCTVIDPNKSENTKRLIEINGKNYEVRREVERYRLYCWVYGREFSYITDPITIVNKKTIVVPVDYRDVLNILLHYPKKYENANNSK
ncbi:hypothetical protein BA065_00655 [Nanoarchaeota archaeon NZ13-N]|nr:MAG: hypothetical protein BA065_00655 [Nanoarchaeota archaeon NZ13-N]